MSSGPLRTIAWRGPSDPKSSSRARIEGSRVVVRWSASMPSTCLVVTIPHSLAMACAVSEKSPVTYLVLVLATFLILEALTMNIRMPASRRVSTTSGISGRGGSTMPTRPTRVNPEAACLCISESKAKEDIPTGNTELERALRAKSRTLLPWDAHSSLISSMLLRVTSSRVMVTPEGLT